MEQDNQEQRRKNLLVGWTIGILVIILYVTSIFYGVGK
jgi:hypothetical protein